MRSVLVVATVLAALAVSAQSASAASVTCTNARTGQSYTYSSSLALPDGYAGGTYSNPAWTCVVTP